MFCPNCGANLQAGSKFCPGCGASVASPGCPGCGSQIPPGTSFCPACGRALKTGQPVVATSPPAAPVPAGISSDLKDLAPGEVVLMDTGTFPITYVKNALSSTNGKLYLTSQRLVFKAGSLQGVGGVYAAGVFIPNPAEANKAKEYFALPLSQITEVKSGWANVTVQAGGQKYKFGGMRKTKEWEEAICRATGR